MSEKLYSYDKGNNKILCNLNDVCDFNVSNVFQLLNSLADENEQLKFENETLKSNYQREIQSSIDFCNAYSKTNGELLEKIEKLEKENEMLKEENEQLKQSNDRFADTVAKQVSLLIELRKENEKLRQIIKDIVCATDETYTKNTSMFKVTVVFDGKMYNQIRSCLYE